MTLKKCSCGKTQMTKNAEFKGRGELACEYLLFNCRLCNSSFAVMNRKDKQRLVVERVTRKAA